MKTQIEQLKADNARLGEELNFTRHEKDNA